MLARRPIGDDLRQSGSGPLALRRRAGGAGSLPGGANRPGDPARIVATGELAARDLDWRMRHSLEEMVRSAWDARSHAAS